MLYLEMSCLLDISLCSAKWLAKFELRRTADWREPETLSCKMGGNLHQGSMVLDSLELRSWYLDVLEKGEMREFVMNQDRRNTSNQLWELNVPWWELSNLSRLRLIAFGHLNIPRSLPQAIDTSRPRVFKDKVRQELLLIFRKSAQTTQCRWSADVGPSGKVE